jgi:hypothetical protein
MPMPMPMPMRMPPCGDRKQGGGVRRRTRGRRCAACGREHVAATPFIVPLCVPPLVLFDSILLHFTPHHFTITAKQRYMPWPSNFSPTRKHTSDSNSLACHDGNSESFHRENYEQRYSDSDAGAH